MPARLRTALLLALIAACTREPEPAAEPSWSIRDSAGVTVVTNHGHGAARGCITIAPDPTVAIPAGPAGPPLFRVRGGAVLDDGRIVVLNAGSRELLFFGPDGRFVRAAGRQGSGPGEFTDPRWLGHGPGDTLFVWDNGLMRLSRFDGAGDLVGIHQVRVGDEQGKPITITGRFGDGQFHFSPGPLLYFDGTPGILRFPEVHGRYDMATGRAEPLVEGAGMEFVSDPGAPIYVLPFGKQDMAVAHEDALVIGDNGTTTVRYHDLRGALRRVVAWEDTPIPVTARDRREYWERFRRSRRTGDEVADKADRAAAEHPRFTSLASDREGWLWVRVNRTDRAPGRQPWLVFDREGVLRCSVDPPVPRFGPLWIGESLVLGWRTTEDDEEEVVLHTLARER